MSGKFESNRAARRKQYAKPAGKKKAKDNTLLCALIALLAVILVVLVVYALSLEVYEAPGVPTTVPTTGQTTPSAEDDPTTAPTEAPTTDPTEDTGNDPTTTPTEAPTTDPTEDTGNDPTTAPTEAPTTEPTEEPTTTPTEDIQINVDPETEFNLGSGLTVTDVGSYTGAYMEDGSDEIVSRVLMAVVTNTSDQDLEYAEITLSGNGKEAKFSVSTLPAGASAVLLEKNRMAFPGEDVFTGAQAQMVSFFDTPMRLHEDVLKLQGLDGALNITNISGQDITGDIVIYYKNSSSDMYYGGITYRVRLQGGLKAGEIRQIMSDHYSASGSKILFVTYNQ